MFKVIFCSFLFLSFSLFGEESEFNLSQSFEAAVGNMESIALGQSQINQSEARVSAKQGNFLPSISAVIDYQRQDPTARNVTNYNSPETGLRLTYSIFRSGRDLTLLAASKADYSAKTQDLKHSKNLLYAEVARSFFQVLFLEQDLRNLSKSEELLLNRIVELKKRIAVGKSREIELLSSNAQLEVLKSQITISKSDLIASRNQFSYLTGLAKDAVLKSPTSLPVPESDESNYRADILNRPDILSLNANLDSSKYSLLSAKAGHLPYLDLTSNYYLSRNGTKKDNNWDIGLYLTIPLFSGGITTAQVREAKEKEIEAELNLKGTLRQTQSTISTAYSNLHAKLDQIKALQIALTATEQNFVALSKDYRYSLATNLDVIQALNTFQDTKRTFDRVRFEAFTAEAELNVISGKVP